MTAIAAAGEQRPHPARHRFTHQYVLEKNLLIASKALTERNCWMLVDKKNMADKLNLVMISSRGSRSAPHQRALLSEYLYWRKTAVFRHLTGFAQPSYLETA